MIFLDELFKQLFGDSNSSNSTSNSNNSNTTVSSSSEKVDIQESINREYKNIDGKGKLKGVLFTDLINKTNETINGVNEQKKNTKLK